MTQGKKTHKILDICEDGYRVFCIKDLTGRVNPYKLYHQFWVPGKGQRRRLIASYADFESILEAAKNLYTEGDIKR